MNFDPVIPFATDVSTLALVVSGVACVSAVALGTLCAPFLSKRVLPDPKESMLSDFLPFSALSEDGATVLLKNGGCAHYYLLSTGDQTLASDGAFVAEHSSRTALLDQLASLGLDMRLATMRIETQADAPDDHQNPTAASIASSWNKQFKSYFRSVNVLCLEAKTQKTLDEARLALSTLGADGAVLLDQKGENIFKLTIGEFLGRQASPCGRPRPAGVGPHLDAGITSDTLWFRPDGIMEFSHGSKKLYGIAIGAKGIGSSFKASMGQFYDGFPGEIVVNRVMLPYTKEKAIVQLKLKRNLARTNSEGGEDYTAEGHAALAQSYLDGIDASEYTMFKYCETVFVYSESISDCLDKEEAIMRAMIENGLTPAREKGATEAGWFCQFPGYVDLPRPFDLFSPAIALHYTLKQPNPGMRKSDWGEGPVALFRNASGTPYSFQFHQSVEQAALGHSLIIAPSGSGKTMLVEFLSAMASRNDKLKTFYFDRHKGTAIYNLAMGGDYVTLNSDPLPWSNTGGLNPFDCEGSDTERATIAAWLEGLAHVKEEDTSAQSEIANAVDIAFEIPREHRSLKAIYDVAFTPGGSVKDKLLDFAIGKKSSFFNAKKDAVSLDDQNLVAFDMTAINTDKRLAGATVEYLMNRIKASMTKTGSPAFLFIDETAPLIEKDNGKEPRMAKFLKEALQEFRKIRGVVTTVFQSPQSLENTGMGEVIRQQSANWFLFQNPGAQAKDYDAFDLKPRELDFVMGRSKLAQSIGPHSVLLKRPLTGESVVLDIDLTPLGPKMKLLSSSSEDLNTVKDIFATHGENWIKEYIGNEL